MRVIDRRMPKPRESNEISNREQRDRLKKEALGLLAQNDDFGDITEKAQCEFGYLYDIRDRGVEALFKLMTNKTTAYFLVQGGKLSWVSYDEELFKSTAESFLYMHLAEYEGRKICKCGAAILKSNRYCPRCGREYTEPSFKPVFEEGEGRKYGAGGDACEYCPHCDGSKNWCPWVD